MVKVVDTSGTSQSVRSQPTTAGTVMVVHPVDAAGRPTDLPSYRCDCGVWVPMGQVHDHRASAAAIPA